MSRERAQREREREEGTEERERGLGQREASEDGVRVLGFCTPTTIKKPGPIK